MKGRRAVLFVGAGVSMSLGIPSLAEFYYRERGSLDPLRDWVTRRGDGGPVDVSSSAIHRAIVDTASRSR